MIKKWVSESFEILLGQVAELQTGVQDDSTDCGLCTINAIALANGHEELWRQSKSDEYRVNWFIKLSNEFRVRNPDNAIDS